MKSLGCQCRTTARASKPAAREPKLTKTTTAADDRDRRSRLHGDAQLAMVGVAVQRMHVRHLDHGQQRQQSQTQQSGSTESSWLPTAARAEMGLESLSNYASPASRIHSIRRAGSGLGSNSCGDFRRIGLQTLGRAV